MLLPEEQLTLAHAGLTPQGRATLGTVLAGRSTILVQTSGDGSTSAGVIAGGIAVHDGLVYANTTVPAGNTVANTVTTTIFTSKYPAAANQLQAGNVIDVKAWGVYGTDAVAPTLLVELLFRTIVIATTGVFTTTAGLTNKGWWLEAQVTVNSVGAAAAMEAQGYSEWSTAATTGQSVNMANTATVAVNTTLASNLQLRVTWGTANANNTITLRNLAIRIEQAQTTS